VQADALVDVYYYSLNAAAKNGFNISAVFGIVHAANMAKRDPATGKFLKREDGKIIKPSGWQVITSHFRFWSPVLHSHNFEASLAVAPSSA
jgi:predicted HAD superfamily Cof-like phosphohydrolase